MKAMAPMMLALLGGSTTLAAQKVPLPDGSGRLVQLFDMHKLQDPADVADKPQLGLLPASAPAPDQLQAVADMLARFVEPPLAPGDDLRALGGRWLVLLGSPAQIASADRIFQTAIERKLRLIDVQAKFFELTEKDFTATLKPRLVQVERDKQIAYEMVFESKDAPAIVAAVSKAAAMQLDAPRLTVRPLQRATMSMHNQTAYVKDFEMTRVGDTVIADPIVDIVWDGHQTEVLATFLPDGMLGVSCEVTFQEVQKPIATFNTTMPGMKLPATIQLPRVSGTRLKQVAVIGDGAMVALASQKVDGSFLVALVTANVQGR